MGFFSRLFGGTNKTYVQGDVSGRTTSFQSSGNLNVITVDGTTYTVCGNNVRVHNGSIYVDGDLVVGGLKNEVHVKWEGDLASVDCTSLHVTGNIYGDVDATNVTVGGSVEAHEIDATNVTAGGAITAKKIDATNVRGVK